MRPYTFIDYATQAYLLLIALLILLLHGSAVPGWPWYILVHLTVVGLLHGLLTVQARWPANRWLDFLRHYYPILLYAGLYRESGDLNQMIFSGYLDAHFLRFEQWLFGWQPGLELMERFPARAVAEVLYASYFSYYLMIAGVGLVLFLRQRRAFFHYICVVSFVFYCCYLTYVVTPVVGPRILCRGIVEHPPLEVLNLSGPPGTPATVQASFFYQLMLYIYDHCETPGAAFPSSHVAIALVTVYFSFLYLRPIRWLHLAVALLLCVATVYGRYHYVVDVVAGALTAAILIPTGNWLFRRYGGEGEVTVGRADKAAGRRVTGS
jgi:membrane-associated phospholipid phosphatase